jgi:uncharacterized protein YlzI (FlbEa/FlbD family)
MLVEFTRAPQNASEAGEVRRAAIRPEGVAAYFESVEAPGVVVIRFMDGRGFFVRGNYAEVRERLGVPLIEFDRALQQESDDAMGEDDGIPQTQVVHKVAIKPQGVAAVFESTQAPNVVIIRLLDGRGFQVRGTYDQVQERLASEGRLPSQPSSGEQEQLH